MSGGAYEYASYKLETLAESIRDQHTDPLRRAFADHIRLIAKAMHDIEWADSGDTGPDSWQEATRAVIAPTAELEAATRLAEHAAKQLQAALDRAR